MPEQYSTPKALEKPWGSNYEPDYESIAEVEWSHQPYEFDMTCVYRQKSTGRLFYAEDSGCSCPTPFQNATEDDLHPIDRMQDWHDHVTERSPSGAAVEEAETARRAIRDALTAQKEA